jgi:hypothetical protein
MADKTAAHYAAEALERFTTAMAAKGHTPMDALAAMWTVCNIQFRRAGYTPQEMADLLIGFQRAYTNRTTH